MRVSPPCSVGIHYPFAQRRVSGLPCAIRSKDPRTAKGIVRREVTRVLTPGLTEDLGSLRADENHYVVAIAPKGDQVGTGRVRPLHR